MKTWQILVLLGVVVGVSYLVFIRPSMNQTGPGSSLNPPPSPVGPVTGTAPPYVAPTLARALSAFPILSIKRS